MILPKIVGQNNFANQIARDKYKTYQYFKDLLPLAKIYDSNNIEYPIFIKPRVGEGAKNTKIIRTKEEMNLFLNEFDINKFVSMEYLSGEEYTIDCFSHKGKIKFIGPRTREGTISGAALVSNTITDKDMIHEFAEYANIISEHLGMDGHWFFQMKKSKSGELKLLEVSTRIAGTSAVNRVLGINFIELSLYNAIGNNIDICINNFNIGIYRESKVCYNHDIKYDNLYIDFDDTLVFKDKSVNTDLIKLIYQARNEHKKVILLTKNNDYSLTKKLLELKLYNLFDDIIHIPVAEEKHTNMEKNSILIDDSFIERKSAIDNGYIALGLDNFEILLK